MFPSLIFIRVELYRIITDFAHNVKTLIPLFQVLKVVLVVWANLVGLDLLVSLDLLVTLDLLVFLDPLETQVTTVQGTFTITKNYRLH